MSCGPCSSLGGPVPGWVARLYFYFLFVFVIVEDQIFSKTRATPKMLCSFHVLAAVQPRTVTPH